MKSVNCYKINEELRNALVKGNHCIHKVIMELILFSTRSVVWRYLFEKGFLILLMIIIFQGRRGHVATVFARGKVSEVVITLDKRSKLLTRAV